MQKLERFRKDFVLRGEEREEDNLNEAASHAKVRKSWKRFCIERWAELLAVRWACKAIFWPTPGLTGRKYLWYLNSRKWNLHFCVLVTPWLEGVETGAGDREVKQQNQTPTQAVQNVLPYTMQNKRGRIVLWVAEPLWHDLKLMFTPLRDSQKKIYGTIFPDVCVGMCDCKGRV